MAELHQALTGGVYSRLELFVTSQTLLRGVALQKDMMDLQKAVNRGLGALDDIIKNTLPLM